MTEEKSKLIYSTGKSIQLKKPPDKKTLESGLHPEQQKPTVQLDRKARGGKSVTVLKGLQLTQPKREELLKQLKTKLGTGGTIRDSSIEIQGDHRDSLVLFLEQIGYKPKRAGG